MSPAMKKGRIAIVGTGAAGVADRAFGALNAAGIDGRVGDLGERIAQVRVHVERIPEALRLLHAELLEPEDER